MHRINYFFLLGLICFSIRAHAQNSFKDNFTFSAYGELYYSYDFSEPKNHEKADFLYNHKRHNELNANLLMVKANYTDKRVRSNIGFMAGNYAQYNLSAEPTWAQFIYEANIGVKLIKQKSLWLEAGIFPSHIGFESAIGADCWTLSRSLLAENSPYYEAGLRLNYTSKNEKFNAKLLYLNGWQRIQKPVDINRPSFGAQLSYTINSTLMLNYSNFVGTDKPDNLKSTRHFHNFYIQYEPTEYFGIIAGFDIGSEKTLNRLPSTWYSPVLILRQKINKQTSISIRGEYYADKDEIIVNTGSPNGLQLTGVSSNVDYKITTTMMARAELKWYHSKDAIFPTQENRNYSITTSLSLKL